MPNDNNLVNSNSSEKIPFKSHPIYKLRKCLLLNAVAGVVLSALAMSTAGYMIALWATALIVLALSGILALVDLCLWVANNKSKNGVVRCDDCHNRVQVVDELERTSRTAPFEPSTTTPLLNRDTEASNAQNLKDEPQWPKKWIMILDFLFGAVLIWLWVACLGAVNDYGYYYESAVSALRSYATVALLVGSVLHFKSWWAALMARKKASWERQLNTISPPGSGNPHHQSLLPIFEPYQDRPDVPRNTSSSVAKTQQPASRHEPTQVKQPRKSFSPLAWLSANKDQPVRDDAARKAALEENQKLIPTLTPSATGSTSASSSRGQERYQDDDETDDQYTSTTLGVHHSRTSNRSMLLSASDVFDEQEGSDTPIAAGMEHAAVVVKKKAKKSGQGIVTSGSKKGKRKQIEIHDEA